VFVLLSNACPTFRVTVVTLVGKDTRSTHSLTARSRKLCRARRTLPRRQSAVAPDAADVSIDDGNCCSKGGKGNIAVLTCNTAPNNLTHWEPIICELRFVKRPLTGSSRQRTYSGHRFYVLRKTDSPAEVGRPEIGIRTLVVPVAAPASDLVSGVAERAGRGLVQALVPQAPVDEVDGPRTPASGCHRRVGLASLKQASSKMRIGIIGFDSAEGVSQVHATDAGGHMVAHASLVMAGEYDPTALRLSWTMRGDIELKT
jgi:hypothetical protein